MDLHHPYDPSLVQKVAKYVHIKLHHEPSGHDWFHTERVWKIAKFLQQSEGGNMLVIEVGALLHNLMEHNFPLYEHEKPLLALHGMMDVLQIEEPLRSEVVQVIEDSKYKADSTRRHPPTKESQILQDANWLDALGAIGIARAFASGGYVRRPIHDPNIPVRSHMDQETYQKEKRSGTSYNYLFEKSMKIVGLLNTETAKRVARARMAYMESFIEEFQKEWNGEDIFSEAPITTP